jgi:GNAT superfamily N-acetyltransferase
VDNPVRDIEANFLAAYSWLQRAAPAAAARLVGGMLCCRAPDELGELTDFNVALPDPATPPPDPSSPDFRETLRQVRAFFQGRAFSCWIRPGSSAAPAARDLGFSERADYTGQYLEFKPDGPAFPGADEASDGGLTVRRVATLGELMAFADLAAAGWSLESGPYRRFFASQASRLFAADCPKRLYVGWAASGFDPARTQEGVSGGTAPRLETAAQAPVCCMDLFAQPESGVAGVYYVATHAAFRRRGHALRLQAGVLEEARNAGFRAAVVISEPGERRLMLRLGFVDQGPWHEYTQNEDGGPTL